MRKCVKITNSISYYRITEYTPDLSQGEVDATIAQAFKLYSDVTPLSFKQVYSDTADIMILFKARSGCTRCSSERQHTHKFLDSAMFCQSIILYFCIKANLRDS